MQNVERAFASIERRVAQHARYVVGQTARVANMPVMREAARSSGRGSARQEASGLAKSFTEIAKASRSQIDETKRLARENRGLADSFKAIARSAESAERAQIRAATRARSEFKARTGRVVGQVGEALGGIGATALSVTGLGGGALVASRLGGAAALERRQRQVIVNARGAGQANAIEYGALQSRIANTATATGASQEDITGGIEKFVQRTGDLSTAVGLMNSLALASVATGSSMEDLAGVAADLQQKFDIKKPEEMADALAVLAMQGKKGAFELRDMANTFPELAAAAARVGMGGVGGMRQLGGLAQIARSATGSGEEASTALQMAFTQIGAKGAKLQAGLLTGGRKVDVFRDKGMTQFRDMPSVVADVIAGTRGNIPELEKIFEVRGSRAFAPLITQFNQAHMAALGGGATEEKATAAGRDAIVKAIEDASNATGTYADLQRDAADVQKSASVQLERLNSELTSAVQKDLLPALVRLIPQFQRLIPVAEKGVEKLAEFIAWIAENPFTGLGSLVLGKVAADLAMAGIGAGVKSVLVSIITGIAAQGGLFAASGAAVSGGAAALTTGGTALAGRLGMGAAAGAGVAGGIAGALALGGAGAAGYNIYKLHEETRASGGILSGIAEAFRGPAKATTREEYDRMYGPTPGKPAQQDRETAKLMHRAAQMQLEAAKLTAARNVGPNRGNSPSPIKG